MTIEVTETTHPTEADWQAVTKPLHAYNYEKAGGTPAERIALILKDSISGESVGGLHGQAYWNWLHIDLLFVPTSVRGKGIGSELLARAERFGKQKNCLGVWLDTFSFQAPEFYRKHGYETFASLENYPRDESRIFFRKRLSGSLTSDAKLLRARQPSKTGAIFPLPRLFDLKARPHLLRP